MYMLLIVFLLTFVVNTSSNLTRSSFLEMLKTYLSSC